VVAQKPIGEFVCYFIMEASAFVRKDLFPKYTPYNIEIPVEGFSGGTAEAES
jgi:hypothetical protein